MSKNYFFTAAIVLGTMAFSCAHAQFEGAKTLQDCDATKYPDNCYRQIYKSIQPTVDACKKIATVEPYAMEMIDHCAFRVGMSLGKKECSKFKKGGRAQQQCMHGVAIATKNAALCLSLPNTKESNKLGHGDPAIYGNDFIYSDMQMRDDCYAGISIKTLTTKYCSKITGDPVAKKFCFIDVGIKKRDVNVCKLLPQQNRDECLCNVNNAIHSATIDCSPRN
jgi:hypothetical protein